MCPDKKMITSYVDCTLDEEYKKILDQHFDICPKCRLKAEKQKSVSGHLKSIDTVSDLGPEEKRGWDKISNTVPAEINNKGRIRSVPFPMFAAAAALLPPDGKSAPQDSRRSPDP